MDPSECVLKYFKEKGIKIQSSCFPENWTGGVAEYNIYYEQRRNEILEKQGYVKQI
jgi:hypothetical protein